MSHVWRISHKIQVQFEDTKGVIRIRISKKNRQHNDQKKKYKQRSTKHTYKTTDRVTRTPLKTGGEQAQIEDTKGIINRRRKLKEDLKNVYRVLIISRNGCITY